MHAGRHRPGQERLALAEPTLLSHIHPLPKGCDRDASLVQTLSQSCRTNQNESACVLQGVAWVVYPTVFQAAVLPTSMHTQNGRWQSSHCLSLPVAKLMWLSLDTVSCAVIHIDSWTSEQPFVCSAPLRGCLLFEDVACVVYAPGSSDLDFSMLQRLLQGFRSKNSLHEGILKRQQGIMERALTLN